MFKTVFFLLEKKSRRYNFDMIKYIYLKILRSTPDELFQTGPCRECGVDVRDRSTEGSKC